MSDSKPRKWQLKWEEEEVITDWEVGQDLCHLSDEIGERMADMKDSHPKVYWMLDEIRRTIGDTFNREPFKTSHKFGLISHNDSGSLSGHPTPRGEGDGE